MDDIQFTEQEAALFVVLTGMRPSRIAATSTAAQAEYLKIMPLRPPATGGSCRPGARVALTNQLRRGVNHAYG